jgi:hypothetical protein
MQVDRRHYIYRVLDAASQFMNVLFLNGDPNESISARVWRLGLYRAVKIINKLFFWQKNHCKAAYENDLARNHEYIKREA